MNLLSSVSLFSCVLAVCVPARAAVDFLSDVRPIMESACISCHGPEKDKGGLRLHTLADTLKGGESGTSLVPGKPDESSLYTSTILPADHDDVMPPKKSGLLLPEQTVVLKQWISEGAKWPEGVVLVQIPRVDFVKDVQPILEQNCVGCHYEKESKSNYRLDERALAATPGESGDPALTPGVSAKSSLYTTTILSQDDELLMPPKKKGGPLAKDVTDVLKNWIDGGAPWPSGIKLLPRKAEPKAGGDEAGLVLELHKRITGGPQIASAAEMKPYVGVIPGAEVKFDMVPIPAGKFRMGTSDAEPGRKADEGPQREVEIAPFWMGAHEVTWNQFELFMYPEEEKKARATKQIDPQLHALSDAVTHPTQPYVEMSFGMGKDGFPAISMTQHAANKFCQWLSAKTGQFHRLPTEAEWEYAARAGTSTAYFWGDDASKIGDYCWWGKNSDFKYQKVGRKKANPWGLYDISGNVIEWCLDQYNPNYYGTASGPNPWNKATRAYPHVARGGSWDDEDPAKLRLGARRGSDPSWKIQDPQLPKSIWYHTDAQFLGFRVVRPLLTPSAEEMQVYWNNGVEKDIPGVSKPANGQ